MASEDIALMMIRELNQAKLFYGPFHSPHEALSVIREEYKELEAEVFKHNRDKVAMKHEAIQVGAMAIRFIQDCCQ